jgi:hypothetical protein
MGVVRSLFKLSLLIVLLVVTFGGGWIVGRTGIAAGVSPASLNDLERQFTERMRAATLVGKFTVDGRQAGDHDDRYDIAGVTKVGDNLWRFDTRMRHSSVDVTMPMTVPVQWIGDTPMVVMTDYSLPGVGTFTCRVFFYGDRYAGTWQHGRVGGLMYGRIEKQTAEQQQP